VHGCTGDNVVDRSGPSDDRTITFVNYAYTPKCLRIAAGQTVTFSGDFESHPLVGGEVVGSTANPDPSSPIPLTMTGTMQAVLFADDGVFPYFCAFHGQTNAMFGAVFVDP
jgi:plastocyanin